LARQIEGGARADVFMSADPTWGSYLAGRGLHVSGDTMRITTSLVLIARGGKGGAFPADRISEVRRLAIGDPAYVPAGAYAREWLDCMDLWTRVSDRLVPTVDVRAAVAAVLSGAVDAAIVYASDVLVAGQSPNVAVAPLDYSCQPIVRYGIFVLMGEDVSAAGSSFASFANAPEQRTIWERFGFEWR
ncbi:MAG: molybdate ABC transporter substrate-binding protein, partial [Rhodothermales bacterium]|nr:molybdate ABC transporter substrate-binding protein [Rhodothermales bacterium]